MKTIKNQKKIKIFLLLMTIFILTSCNMILMNPVGEIAIKEKKLILIVLSLMSLIVIPVILMTIFFSFKYRMNNKKSIYSPNWNNSKKIEFFCWTIPILIIFILGIITWKTTHQLDPYKKINNSKKPINIQVIALSSKWMFIYPKEKIATINKMAIPIDTPINFQITSGFVMNSFFIPSLGSQIYAMPGMQTKLHLIANQSGKYQGFSSSYSGNNFSNMKFTVIIYSNVEKFKHWINKTKKSKNKIIKKINIQKLDKIINKKKISSFSLIDQKIYENIILKSNCDK